MNNPQSYATLAAIIEREVKAKGIPEPERARIHALTRKVTMSDDDLSEMVTAEGIVRYTILSYLADLRDRYEERGKYAPESASAKIIDAADEALARACAVFKIGDRVRWIGEAPQNPRYNPGDGTVTNVTRKRVCVMFDNFKTYPRARSVNMLPRDLQPIEHCSVGNCGPRPEQAAPVAESGTSES